jgi:isoleucyl-tRNA synthetase
MRLAHRASIRRLASKPDLKATLNLPRTEFALHANLALTEHRLVPRLAHEHFSRQADARASAPPFVLHDGPPYANGELHMGHFLNKALKDMINRWKLLRGYRIEFTPGWDCHGLPIELRALQLAGAEAAHELPPLRVREQAAECARQTIAEQRQSFVRWGVMADWHAPYTTMQPRYEAAQLGVLRAMLRRGLLFRGVRPVHWSPASRTALAEAELDYVDAHESSAAYVAFSLARDGALPHALTAASAADAPPALVVWTTTPWTLPANQAICAREDLVYALVRVGEMTVTLGESGAGGAGGAVGAVGAATAAVAPAPTSLLLVAEARVGALGAALGRELHVCHTLEGNALRGLWCLHPLSGRRVPVLFGEHVTDTAGTGLVHTAPGHGPEDFAVGQAHGLASACPVDEHGRFTRDTDEAVPFVGLHVLKEGNAKVLEALTARGALVHVERYLHRYPYDWLNYDYDYLHMSMIG